MEANLQGFAKANNYQEYWPKCLFTFMDLLNVFTNSKTWLWKRFRMKLETVYLRKLIFFMCLTEQIKNLYMNTYLAMQIVTASTLGTIWAWGMHFVYAFIIWLISRAKIALSITFLLLRVSQGFKYLKFEACRWKYSESLS